MADQNSYGPSARVAQQEVSGPAELKLGHLLTGIGAEHDPPISLHDMLLIRHSFKPDGHDGLQGPQDLAQQRVQEYTRTQDVSARRFPAQPPRYWVVLVADGQSRSRLYGTFENRGEVPAERSDTERSFDLRPSRFLASLADRLVVDWISPRRWYRSAERAADFTVLEIADRDRIPFPGFDRVLLSYLELQEMVEDRRYSEWRAVLSEVQGIYLITDSSNGKQYVGKADGAERILGRWRAYARDGHGGNVRLRALVSDSVGEDASVIKTSHARHFQFSLLRVFGPSTSSSEVDAAESHYKMALMTGRFGLNGN